jgi:hypothetical protein
MKMFKVILFLVFISSSFGVYAQIDSENRIEHPDTVKVGMFINSIYDLNFEERSFKIDFWLWCVFKNKELPINDWVEFPQTKSFEFNNIVQEEHGDLQWLTMRGSGEVLNEWDAQKFPFDTYKLTTTIGLSSQLDYVVFVADTLGSMVDPDFLLLDWEISNQAFNHQVKTYTTSFGDPNGVKISQYPEFTSSIVLTRKDPWRTLIKYSIGLFIAIIISVSAFFMHPNKDPRFDLCVGGLFTAVGNKYITDSITPVSSGITILDFMHHLTFICIFIVVAVSVFNLYLMKSGGKRNLMKTKVIDISAFLVVSIVFFTGFYLILK